MQASAARTGAAAKSAGAASTGEAEIDVRQRELPIEQAHHVCDAEALEGRRIERTQSHAEEHALAQTRRKRRAAVGSHPKEVGVLRVPL